MMTSSNGTIFRVTGSLYGESTSHWSILSQKPVTRGFDVLFDPRLNKRWANSRDAGGLRRHRAHYDVTVMNAASDDTVDNMTTLGFQCIKEVLYFVCTYLSAGLIH